MIFKLHYGLWFGALVGILPFMFNYASEHTGVSGKQHGALYSLIHFTAFIAKPIFCSVADKYAAHHHVLLLFMFTTLLGYGSLAIYPFIPSLVNHKDMLWILYCISAFIGNTSMCVVNSIGDSLAVQSSQRKNISYGEYRLWGPIGFGLLGPLWSIANDIPGVPKYTPSIMAMVVILLINTLLLACWYDRDEFKLIKLKSRSSSDAGFEPVAGTYRKVEEVAGDLPDSMFLRKSRASSKITYLKMLCFRHSSIIVYFILFTICGVMTAIHWQFFFRYLEQQTQAKGVNFNTIVTLALPVQSLGGEFLFFLLSSKIITLLGPFVSLTLCLLSFSARYLLYAYAIPQINIYWILLVELLQGPAFGLMYSILTHQARHYADCLDKIVHESKLSKTDEETMQNSLHATLQGILGAAFEGLGLGLGAMIGGLVFDASPIYMWTVAGFSCLVVSCVCLTSTIIIFLIKKSSPKLSKQQSPNPMTSVSMQPTDIPGVHIASTSTS